MLDWTLTEGWPFGWMAVAVVVVAFWFTVRRRGQKTRRRRPLHRDTSSGYVWTDSDGTFRRSDDDRQERGEADSDSGSDGGGDSGGGD